MPAPDWAQKRLCIIVPNRQTVSPEFFSWVRTWLLSSRHTCLVCSPSLCLRGKLLFSTFLTRNEGTKDEWKKNVWDAISRGNWIFPENILFLEGSQCIVNNRKFKTRRQWESQIHSFFYIRMLLFRPRLNILIFLPILGWKYSCIILK